MSRTLPRLIDLMIVLASGGVGPYAISRAALAEALPGVVIARTSKWIPTTLVMSHVKRNDWRFRDRKVGANSQFGRCEHRIQETRVLSGQNTGKKRSDQSCVLRHNV